MAKYLVLWEMDNTRQPVDPKERAAGYEVLVGMLKQNIQSGLLKEWGGFAGETSGFSLVEGTELDVNLFVQQFVPFISMKTHAITSLSQVEEMMKAMQQ